MKRVALMRRLASVPLFCLATWLLLDYPVFRPLLVGVLLGVGALMFRWPRIWLAILPAAVPMLELAHWSGRLFIEDLDLLFAFVLALLLWQQPAGEPAQRTRLPRTAHLLAFALAGSYGASLAIGLFPWSNWGAPDMLANFLGQANALRLAKGFFWAAAFSPFVLRDFRDAPEAARRMVVGGMVAGGLAVGGMALWERGVWQALVYGRDIYQLLAPLLDFSTAYRVTGTFAEMNTGGEAIDGFLGLAWPMMVLALALSRRPWALALSSIALGLVIYSLVTTFSRGLYFSLGVAGAVWLFGLTRVLRAHRSETGKSPLPLIPLLALLLVAALLMGYGYSRGGMLTLGTGMLLFIAAAWLGWRAVPRSLAWPVLALLALGCTWLAARGMTTSKWHPIDPAVAWPTALILETGTVLLGYLAGRLLPRDAGIKPFLATAMLLLVGAGTLAPALLGYRMTERLSGVSTDFATRAGHWRDVWALQQGGPLHALLGMGLGSFPREYFWSQLGHPDGNGSYVLLNEAGNTFLRTTGGKDLRLGQRLDVAAHTPLQLRLRVRNHAPEARLKLRLCRRFVIHPTEWNGQCVTLDHKLVGASAQWQALSFSLDSGQVGDGGGNWGRPPLMLEINNRREYHLMNAEPAVVDIDDVSLTDAQGREYVANGDFEHGLDCWLPYYDFNHLPWHVKNIWLHLYFEQGLLGVLAFAAAWLFALRFAWRAAGRGDVFTLGVAAALTGFVAVGTFGSPIDAPRVAWLYYFLWFVLVAQTQTARPTRPRARLRRRSASQSASSQ